MGNLISDPIGWTGKMVSSRPRFAVFAVFFVLLVGMTVYIAASRGWYTAMGFAVFLAAFQLYFLYALRRLYFIVATNHRPESDVA